MKSNEREVMDTPEQIAEELVYRHNGVTFNSSAEATAHLKAAIVTALTAERQRAEAAECERDEADKDRTDMMLQRRRAEERADELLAHNAVLLEALVNNRRELGHCAMQLASAGWNVSKDGSVMKSIHAADAALSTTPAASLDALTQRVRAEAMEEAAKIADNFSRPKSPKHADHATIVAAAIRQRAQEG